MRYACNTRARGKAELSLVCVVLLPGPRLLPSQWPSTTETARPGPAGDGEAATAGGGARMEALITGVAGVEGDSGPGRGSGTRRATVTK